MSRWRNTEWAEHNPSSPNEKWAPGNSSMQRRIMLLDGSLQGRVQAAYDFLGYQVVIGAGGLNYIHRVIPMPYPGLSSDKFSLASLTEPGGTIVPDITQKLFVEAISRTEPIASSSGIDSGALPVGVGGSDYPRVYQTLECVTYPFAIIDDATLINQGGVYKGNPDEGIALAKGWQYTRYITRKREAFSRVITVPYGIMMTNAPPQSGKTAKLNKTGIPFREGGENRTYTWMRVPLTPPGGVVGAGAIVTGANFGLIEGSLGTINDATFDGCTKGTLLLDSIGSREYQGSFGEWLADITFNMIYLPHASSEARFASWKKALGPFPTAPDGTPLTKGVPAGWNTVLDVDWTGAWDYYDVASAAIVGDHITWSSDAIKPYQYSDFTAFFRPST